MTEYLSPYEPSDISELALAAECSLSLDAVRAALADLEPSIVNGTAFYPAAEARAALRAPRYEPIADVAASADPRVVDGVQYDAVAHVPPGA